MTPEWRNRLNLWWQDARRRRIPKAIAAIRATLPELSLPVGWGLITLAAFGWNARAWEASTGAYLVFTVVVKFLAVYYSNKAAASRRRPE